MENTNYGVKELTNMGWRWIRINTSKEDALHYAQRCVERQAGKAKQAINDDFTFNYYIVVTMDSNELIWES